MRDETEGRSEGLRGRPQLRLCPIGDGEIGGGFRAAEGCVCVCVCVCVRSTVAGLVLELGGRLV